MAKKSNKQVNIILGLNMTQFQRGLMRAQSNLKKFGKKMSRFGASMSRNVTLPLVGAAIAGIKMASDLEKSFAKIENLVGVTGPVLEGFKEKLKDISTETAISQKSLADALFVITSAGIRSAKAMDILAQSAKSSQVGMGETEDIARGITGAMNSYAKSNLTAARSADIMMAIVREGNLVASDLAPTLGRVTGMAAELGISFEELGANIATFTRLGVPTEEAVTGLRGVMSAVLKPTKAAEEVLASITMTSSDLRKMVGKEGLHGTLMFLIDALKGNEKGLSSMFGNVRALSNVLGTAGAQGESYAKILDSIANSTGMVDEAFENVSKTSAFKFDMAIVALKNNAIELGAVMLPVAVKIVDGITNMVQGFRDMNPVMQKAIMIAGGLAAAIGPLAFVIGATSLAISNGIKSIGKSIATANPLLLAATLVMTGLIAAMALIKAGFGSSTKSMSANERGIRSNRTEANLLLETIKNENISQGTRNRLIEKFNKNFGEYGGNLITEEGALSNILDVQKKLNIAFSNRLNDTIIKEKQAKIEEEQLDIAKKRRKEDEAQVGLLNEQTRAQKMLTAVRNLPTQSKGRDEALLDAESSLERANEALRESQDRVISYDASIAAAAISLSELDSQMSTFKTPEEMASDEDAAQVLADALKKEQDAIDKKAAIVRAGKEKEKAEREKVNAAKLKAIEIQNEATLSLLSDEQRETTERKARHTEELAILKTAGDTNTVNLEKELQKDLLEIRKKYLAEGIALDVEAIASKNELLAESYDMLREKAEDLAKAYSDVLKSSMIDVVSGMAELAGAMAMGEATGNDMVMFLLDSFAGMLEKLGAIALTVAFGVKGIKSTLENLDPGPALVAGVALFALAGAARAGIKILGRDMGEGAPALAHGGLAFGPTMAMVGDNKNASIDPEVIAPLSKLKAMMGSGNQNITVTGRLRGADLLISNERASRTRSRYRGF